MSTNTRSDVVGRDMILVTCEHGGNHVPSRYCSLFQGWQDVLASHRGFDLGALRMALDLARAFGAPLVYARVSRLLIDLNRSLHNPRVWSSATRHLPQAEKQFVVERHYQPYRERVEQTVREAVQDGRRVIHLSSHSFTPVLDGEVRQADLGVLYDPTRAGERELAGRWKSALSQQHPDLRVRRNYPYAGRNDGLTSTLRRQHDAECYIGLEIESNQALVLAGSANWLALRRAVIDTLLSTLSPGSP